MDQLDSEALKSRMCEKRKKAIKRAFCVNVLQIGLFFCEYAMNIGVAEIYSFHREKVLFCISDGHCLQFLKRP